jgi:hypothetical protein
MKRTLGFRGGLEQITLTLSATEVVGIHASTLILFAWVGIPLLRFHPHPSQRRSIGQTIGLTAYEFLLRVPSIITSGAVQLLQYCSSISFVGQQGRLFRAPQSRQSTQTRTRSSASTLTYLVFVGLTHREHRKETHEFIRGRNCGTLSPCSPIEEAVGATSSCWGR